MKIIHTGDWHLREKGFDEIKKCVGFILEYARHKETPDLFVISGDMTDSKFLGLDTRSAKYLFWIITQMLNIAPVVIVIGTPSHDGKSALALRSCRGKYPILVSDLPGQFGYVKGSLDSPGDWMALEDISRDGFSPAFILSQLPQPTKQYFINQLSILDTDKAIGEAMDSIFASFGNLPEGFEDVPHIVNGHGQIGGAFISETQQLIGVDIEISKSQLASLNADLKCFGHIHKSQSMGNGIFYAGSPTRMNHGETEDKGFYLHDIDQGVESNFIKTPAIYLHDAKFDLTKEEFPIEFMTVVESMCEGISDDHDEWGVKITITAWQDEAKAINQAELERLLLTWGAERVKVSIIRKPRETVRSEKVLAADSLPDKLIAMAEMRGEAVPESILEKARMIEGGGV